MSRRDRDVSGANAHVPWCPSSIGGYQVIEPIGVGSTGVVLKCRDPEAHGVLAIKIANGSGRGERAALRREFALLSRLRDRRHGGVVRVVTAGREDGRPWFAMEHVDGVGLASLVDALFGRSVERDPTLGTAVPGESASMPSSGPRSVGERPLVVLPTPFSAARTEGTASAGCLGAALSLAARIARALAGLHAEGVVHADLSPRNVLVAPDGVPTLVDFSSSFYVTTVETARELVQPELGLRGTPGYMAPEQLAGQQVDGRADLYALGCLLYELIAGRPPFTAETVGALAAQHLRASPDPPSLHVAGVPRRLDGLVLGLLEKEPHRRIGYADDVAVELEALSGAPSSLPPSAVRDRARHLFRPRTVGRDAQSAALEARLQEALAGRGGVVMLKGESGSGKTRLLNDLGAHAQRLGVEVVASRCSEPVRSNAGGGHAEEPLEAFKPLLERVADHAGTAAGRALSVRLAHEFAALARYEPSLAVGSGAALEPPMLPPELARRLVVSSLARTMLAFSESRPLLVAIDDLQWSDDLTFEFVLLALSGALEGGRVLVVSSYRPEDLDPGRRQVLEPHGDVLLEVGRLDVDAIRSIAKDMLSSESLPEGLVELLLRLSAGNALFAAEYLRTIAGRGDLERDRSGRWTFHPDAAAGALPTSLQEALRQKLVDVSDAARELVERASVLSAGFGLEALEDASLGGDEINSSTVILLQELESRRILEQSEPGRYRFTHDALRGAVERSLSADRRRALHGAAASRLVRDREGRPADVATDAALGNHFAQSGDAHRALFHFERAARRASDGHAYALAAELYGGAVGQAEAIDAASDGERGALIGELREALGDMLQRCARHEEARRNYRGVAGDPAAERLLRVRALRKEGKSHWLVHRYDEALEALEAARRELGDLAALRTPEERGEWIETSQGRFWVHYFSRRIGAESAELVRLMAPVVDESGTPAQKAMFYQCAAGELMAREHYVYSLAAVEHARRAVACSNEERYPAEAADARFALGFALLQGDRAACAEAVEQFGRAIAVVERVVDATVLSRLLTYKAVAHRRLCDVAAVRSTARKALATAEAARLPPYVAAAKACLAWVERYAGERLLARALALEAERIWSQSRHPFPFRRLSAFVLLGACVDEEDYAQAFPLLALLLAPDQQRLPEPLSSALQRAAELGPNPDARLSSEALGYALEVARRLGFD